MIPPPKPGGCIFIHLVFLYEDVMSNRRGKTKKAIYSVS